MTSFRSNYVVMSRQPGNWIDGKYYPEQTGLPRNVSMTIQQPSPADAGAIEAMPLGRRDSRFIKIYTSERLNAVSQAPGGSPGDLVLYDSKQFLVIGEVLHIALQRTRPLNPVSHYKYYAAEVIEAATGETVP